MTMLEVLEQAKALSVQERKELTKLLIDTLDTISLEAEQDSNVADDELWGKQLVQVLQQTEYAEWGDPTIADAVEAVQAIREQEQARLAPYWSGEK